MNCQQFSYMIDKILDKDLTLDEETAYKEHIARCKKCSEELEELTNIECKLSSMEKKKLPENFTTKVVNAAKQEGLLERKPNKISALSKISLAVASFLFLFLLLDVSGLGFNRTQNQSLDNVNPLGIQQEDFVDEGLPNRTMEGTLGFLSEGTAKNRANTNKRNIFMLCSAILLSTPFFVEVYKKKTTY